MILHRAPWVPLATALAAASLAEGAQVANAEVTYLTSATVYVAAGLEAGLVTGTQLTGGGDPPTVVLEAFESTGRRAACRVVSGAIGDVRTGAVFTYTPSMAPALASAEGRPPRKPAGIHGRAGVRYLVTRNGLNGSANGNVQQPALDARLDGPSLYGSPWGFRVDARARRTFRSGPDLSRTAVYSLQGFWDKPGPGWRVAAGRQYAPDLSEVSTFDGALVAYDSSRWSAGAFVGFEPDEDFHFSTDVSLYGGFYSLRGTAGEKRFWSFSTGALASYHGSVVNRQFVFFRGSYTGSRLTALVTQEVDVNTGWKRDAGEGTFEPTSTFASLRYLALEALDVVGGVDDRRNVRLYRDYVSPETEFDDAFRLGVWAGLNGRCGKHTRLSVYARSNSGGDAGSAESYTGLATFVGLAAGLDARVRVTRYTGDRLEGWLYAAGVGSDLGSRFRIGGDLGLRQDRSPMNSVFNDDVVWFAANFDVNLGRHFWGTVSYDYSSGDFERVDQLYVTLAYRF